jgi:hypothetical protein
MVKNKIEEEMLEDDEQMSDSQITMTIGKQTFYIRSDKYQWILGKYRYVKKKDKEEFVGIGFYSTLQGLMAAMLEKKLRCSDYNSITDLLKNVKIARDELNDIFDTTVRDEIGYVVPNKRPKLPV